MTTSGLIVQHTPGPWVAKGRYIGVPNHMSYIGECRDQNGNWSDEPMASANARLIAAAPELLDALKGMDEAFCGNFDTRSGRTAARKALIAARAAIAKAEGKP